MKVRVTLAFGEHARRALAAFYGDDGLASRERLVNWIELVVQGAAETVVSEYDEAAKAAAERKTRETGD